MRQFVAEQVDHLCPLCKSDWCTDQRHQASWNDYSSVAFFGPYRIFDSQNPSPKVLKSDGIDVNSFASTIFGRPAQQVRPTYHVAVADDREFIIESDLADKMMPGKEYSVLNGQYLIRRDGIKLHARKVETYDRLVDLR